MVPDTREKMPAGPIRIICILPLVALGLAAVIVIRHKKDRQDSLSESPARLFWI